MRQVNLVKPNRITSDRKIDCKDLRPTSIYSIWWRLYTSCWSKSCSIAAWRASVLPQQIAGGKSSPGAEEHATRMFDAFNTDGYIASLDYSQCYDHVIPADACQAMAMLGLPNALTSTLQFHWEHQVRYIDWNRFVDPVPMRTSTGIPQGDGLSPLSLACPYDSGSQFRQRQVSRSDKPLRVHRRSHLDSP